MDIHIFDVDHGFCALATGDDGTRVLFDCGHNATTGFRPSTVLSSAGPRRPLDALVISHGDEDHISDLPNIVRRVGVRTIEVNDTITWSVLRRIKQESGEIGSGAQALLDWMNPFMAALRGPVPPPPQIPGAELLYFRIPYGDQGIVDLNNLSLVTFLHYGNLHVIFPGDLETKGWKVLLTNRRFRAELGGVNVFVASHHGRENGFCAEVFDYCSPEIVIVSDGAVQYSSQQASWRYNQIASGVIIGSVRRKVLTTRRDGTIRLYQQSPHTGPAWVVPEHQGRPPLSDLLAHILRRP